MFGLKTLQLLVSHVLALGSKFHFNDNCNINTVKNSLLSTLANIKFSFQNLDNNRLTAIRSQVIQLFKTHFNNFLYSKHRNSLHCSEILLLQHIALTKRFLKEHPDLIVTKADKGNVTVLMHRSDYLTKTKVLHSDTNTYTKLTKDPTNIFQNQNNKLIDKLIDSSQIRPSCKFTLKIHNAIPPKLRPIVSNLNTPTCKISKYLAHILSPLKYNSQFYLEDSFQLRRENLIVSSSYTIQTSFFRCHFPFHEHSAFLGFYIFRIQMVRNY